MGDTIERRATNVSLPAALVEEAGIEAALKAERARLWKIENKAAFSAYNAWVEEHGLPLDAFRQL